MKKRSRPIPITPSIWTPDDRVSICFECRTTFNIINRKHHCRICGRIFCNECTKYRIRIPSFIQHFMVSTPNAYLQYDTDDHKRVCKTCFKATEVANEAKLLIYAFAMLPVSISHLYQLRIICKRWKGAVDTLISLWTGLEYKIPRDKYTKLEKKLLETHYWELAGHNRWMVKAVKLLGAKAVSHYSEHSARIKSCKQLFCTEKCLYHLNSYDILELYTHNNFTDRSIDRWVSQYWSTISIPDHKHMMQSWCHIFRKKPYIAIHVLKPLIKENIDLIYEFLFECELQTLEKTYSNVFNELIKRFKLDIDKEIIQDWVFSKDFLDTIRNISLSIHEHRANRYRMEFKTKHPKGVRCPWRPTCIIKNILVTQMEVLQSASKPVKIPLDTSEGIINIIYKKEDVRGDKMTMNITYWIEKLTKRQVCFPRYNVMPLSHMDGIIEILPKTTTLYEIKHGYKSSLQNFILDKHSMYSVQQVRNLVVKSCAAACVLTYMLGVGDRHLENMLVTEDGRIMHIDFSYLLGDDPKHVKSEMRITSDMLDALGGRGSQTFADFQAMCSHIYTILRKKSSFWYCMLMYLADAAPSIGILRDDTDRIYQHVLERMVPGELDGEASMQIVEILKRSSKEGWSVWASDYVHKINNLTKNFEMFGFEWD